jgi:uncharacterized protein (TIGR03067 family)
LPFGTLFLTASFLVAGLTAAALREVSRGTSTIDPLAVPKEIDLEITAGDGMGSILKGIYEVGDRTRRLCFRGGNGWRPREFSGAAGSDSVLIVFERQ